MVVHMISTSTILVCCLLAAAPAHVNGRSEIRGKAGASTIVIKTTDRTAGAIDSLTWNGREFIDSADHGRQLQSASNLDLGKPFYAETFNPTEAGSRRDGAGPRSTSRLLSIKAKGRTLETSSKMAFWLVPGERSEGHLAVNTTALSEHLLTKHVTIGMPDLPHAISYDVTFTLPANERHTIAQFEALTGYMPAEFSEFFTFNPADGKLAPLDDGPGEQPLPVVFSTPDGAYSMGIIATAPTSPHTQGPGYGRFRFKDAHVMKWNCVYRVRDPHGVQPGAYTYRMAVAVGTRDDVRLTLAALAKAVEPDLRNRARITSRFAWQRLGAAGSGCHWSYPTCSSARLNAHWSGTTSGTRKCGNQGSYLHPFLTPWLRRRRGWCRLRRWGRRR